MDPPLRLNQQGQNGHLGRATARHHGLFGARLLLPGCSPRPGGADEPRGMLPLVSVLPPAPAKVRHFTAFGHQADSVLAAIEVEGGALGELTKKKKITVLMLKTLVGKTGLNIPGRTAFTTRQLLVEALMNEHPPPEEYDDAANWPVKEWVERIRLEFQMRAVSRRLDE